MPFTVREHEMVAVYCHAIWDLVVADSNFTEIDLRAAKVEAELLLRVLQECLDGVDNKKEGKERP